MNDISHGLQDVEVEVGVSWDGAVEAGLEKGGPLLLQDAGRATAVVLAHPSHPRKHHLGRTVKQMFRDSVALPSPYGTLNSRNMQPKIDS